MNPFTLIVRPVAFGFRQAGRLLQLTADGLEQVAGGDQARREDRERRPEPAQPAGPERRSTAPPKPLDDVSITRKVETELFRDPDVPKGKINVNTADGVVWLRGEASTPEMINDLERRASEIPEVVRVENLLHLPKTPAPSRADTPGRQQKTRRSRPSQARRPVTTRTSAEKEAPEVAEPTPKEVASQGRGRQPAPLADEQGADEEGGDSSSS